MEKLGEAGDDRKNVKAEKWCTGHEIGYIGVLMAPSVYTSHHIVTYLMRISHSWKARML